MGINNRDMDKNVVLSDEELELLITGLHCVDERSYNFYTTTYTPWSEVKKLKENLRIKLKRVLSGTLDEGFDEEANAINRQFKSFRRRYLIAKEDRK